MRRVLQELLGSAVARRQGEPLQRKHLLSKALKLAHNSLGNHQLVSQARGTHAAFDRLDMHPLAMRHRSACKGSLHHRTSSQGSSMEPERMPGVLYCSGKDFHQCARWGQNRHGASETAAMQVLNALAPCQQEQGDLSGAEAMLRSSVILAKHQQDLTSQVTMLSAQSSLGYVSCLPWMRNCAGVTPGGCSGLP